MAVVKANGYGNGAVRVSQALQGPASSFAVWTEDEAAELCANGITSDILILGLSKHRFQKANIVHTVFSTDEIGFVAGKRVALKINTGMNRMGTDASDVPLLADKLMQSGCKIDSVYTHLFCSASESITRAQVKVFDDVSGGIAAKRHVAASGALKYDFAAAYDYVRCGLALYESAVNVTAKIIKRLAVKKGGYAGYGDKPLTMDTEIAIINIGYGDGYRQLTAQRHVYINGAKCKLINVCMDVSIVDVGCVRANVGDFAEILGENISPNELGASYMTTAYEACSFYGRVRKIYIG